VTALRAVLVDDREKRRDVMRYLVQGDGTATAVVGVANSHDAALAAVREHKPDVAVIDIRMPVPEGLRTVRDLHKAFPDLGIVVCSFDLDEATALDARVEGAHACLAKPASRRALQKALEAACSPPQDAAGGAPSASLGTPGVESGAIRS
jgi:DNA-binding NarL/FixJ family response regulator